MTDLYRVRAVWSGFPGGPGVTTMYGLVGVPMVPNLRAFFLALASLFPVDVSILVGSNGDVIDDASGELTGAWTTTPVLPVVGTANTFYAAPAGAEVQWNTTTILDGHRLRGRTFLVPLAASAYQSDGTISPAAVTIIQNAANTFFGASSGDLVVWHRPVVARPADGSRPAVTARAGGHGLVTGTVAVDKTVVLRSRRD